MSYGLPDVLRHFSIEKTADQWLEPWFGCLTMNNPSIFCEQKWLAHALTDGELFSLYTPGSACFFPVIYVWSTVGIVALLRRKKQQVWQLSLVVCLIGGFLFQLAAEAKARYCLPYYLCCFPLAAAGLSFTAKHIRSRRQRATAKIIVKYLHPAPCNLGEGYGILMTVTVARFGAYASRVPTTPYCAFGKSIFFERGIYHEPEICYR